MELLPPTATEQEIKACDAPRPKSIEDLARYVQTLVDCSHDYGTSVYAVSLAATAAFNLVADKLGISVAQADMASANVMRRLRDIDGPYMIVQASRMLYPQYNQVQELADFQRQSLPWAAEFARRRLRENLDHVDPAVVERWMSLAAQCPAPVNGEVAS